MKKESKTRKRAKKAVGERLQAPVTGRVPQKYQVLKAEGPSS
jgi:hypothetical protein